MHPLTLSVVVPCRNRGPYLRATIDSIIHQDYPHIECIVVDAQSTDDTVEILKSYGEKFRGRIRWVSEPDSGHADAINKGWRMAKGDVLAWLNADDVYVLPGELPGAVGQAMTYLAEHDDVDVVYGDCGAINEQGEHFGYSYLRPWDLEYAVLHCDNCIPQPSAFIRRCAIDRVGMLDTAFHQKKDHELWLRIASQGGVIRHVPRLWAHARAIKGLSFDGRTAAPACVQLTRHYFERLRPGAPDRRAMSNAYLRGIDYAWAGGRLWGLIVRYAVMAVAVDVGNWRGVWGKVGGVMKKGTAKPQALPGARGVEVSWLLSQVGDGEGEALVVEPDDSDVPLALAMRGWRVLAVATRHEPWGFHHPRLRFLRGGLADLDYPGTFDLMVARQLTEVGGAMRLLKGGGRLVMTASAKPQAWSWASEQWWRRGEDGRWVVTQDQGALFCGTLEKD